MLQADLRADRILIVNADDFGQSRGVNEGVVEAFERGVVTSASLMVRWPAVAEAARYARRNPGLSLGLHVDVGEWTVDRGTWTPRYEVVPLDDPPSVRREVWRQLNRFRDLLGRPPSHLDSHQHVHREEPARSVLQEMAEELNVPLRHHTPWVHYCGGFYGQTDDGVPDHDRLSVAALVRLLRDLHPGVTELCCHPASVADLTTAYSTERLVELRTLCDPSIPAHLDQLGIRLSSFDEARRAHRAPRG